MVEFTKHLVKDIGLQKEVMEALPYAVVGGTYEGSLSSPLLPGTFSVLLNHIVPSQHQLKILFLRIWTQEAQRARFSIVQTNPMATGQTGTVEGYPVTGSVPQGIRDYPMLEAPGAEVLRGSLVDPIHVLEGSIDFRLLGATAITATGARYSLTWWGVEKTPER